jgi:hypothetical protein
VVVLDPADGSEVRKVTSGSSPVSALLTAEGDEMVMATSFDGAVRVPLDDAELADLVRSKVVYDIPPALCEDYGLAPDC